VNPIGTNDAKERMGTRAIFVSWLDKFWQGRRSRRQHTSGPRGHAPRIEPLEDRLTPSVNIQFDYSYDAAGWFNSQRRGMLELAGRTLGSRLNDTLAAITPGGANFWQATFWHPSNGAASHINNLAVPANTVIIYVGAYAIDGPGGTIAHAGYGGAGNVSGNDVFQNTVRGRRTMPIDPARDFQPWGGQISFDTSESWYFGQAAGATNQQTDFLSVAMHELCHILGVTEWNPSFASRITAQSTFAGPLASAAYGGAVPLDADHASRSHWADGVRHGDQATLLDPYIAPGQRKLPTGLDWAALADVGWELAADPDATLAGARSVHDPANFTSARAGSTTTYTATIFALDQPLDVDLYRLHAPAGRVLTVQTSARAGAATTDIYLRLFDDAGRELARANTSTYDTLTFSIPRIGTYYIGISSHPNDNYSPTDAFAQALAGTVGAYNLVISLSGSSSPGQRIVSSGTIVVAPDAGSEPLVRVLEATTGSSRYEFYAYPLVFRGGVRVALGDVNGDGVPDIITAPGPGTGPYVRVFDGQFGTLVVEFYAYSADFSGGVFVAAGDLNGDGRADIITGADAGGGPHVRAFSGADHALLADFFAYDVAFRGGVRVASGDFNGDGRADIFTAAGPGGGPNVRVFSGADRRELANFFAYSPAFSGGVYLAAGDLDGDGRAEIIAGAGPGGGPHVLVFRGGSAAPWHGFLAFDPNFRGGVRVATADIDGDGRDELFVAAGPDGGPHVRTYRLSASLSLTAEFFAFPVTSQNGVFLASD
jgi:hypothetical protein